MSCEVYIFVMSIVSFLLMLWPIFGTRVVWLFVNDLMSFGLNCGRVDIKSTPYDTTQLNTGPSWLNKNYLEFGPPLFPLQHNSTVLLSSILPNVYKVEVIIELDSSPSEDGGIVAKCLNQIKWWLYSQSNHINFFFTILVLASVPNPLFDLAGMMCRQFGIPFSKKFLATLIGEAIIKTHIQTSFIILVCNNRLQNALILVPDLFPGLGFVMPNMGAKIISVKDKYLHSSHPAPLETELLYLKKKQRYK
ncbi:hypothetical protein UlMin_041841 [Ulmus minor]